MSIETKETKTFGAGSTIRRRMKFSEKKILRDCDAIPNWRLGTQFRNDLDPEESITFLIFSKSCTRQLRRTLIGPATVSWRFVWTKTPRRIRQRNYSSGIERRAVFQQRLKPRMKSEIFR